MVTDPNFDISKGQGILATKRTDFQKHIDGTDFLQEASTVSLSPPVDINGDTANVREAIISLAAIIEAPILNLNLSGDVTGVVNGNTVEKIRNTAVSSFSQGSLINGQVLAWSGTAWTPSTVSGSFSANNDLSGSESSQTVVGIQGSPISGTAPTTGQVLSWDGSFWSPEDPVVSGGGSFTAGGDLSGSETNQTVISLRGNNVGSTGIPSDGQVLTWVEPIGWIAQNAVGNTFIANGDLSGDENSQTVAGLQGNPVVTTAPLDGQVLLFDTGQWRPGTVSALYTAAGDLTGSNESQTVVKISGYFSGAQKVDVAVKVFQFESDIINPILSQATSLIGDGYNLNIQAQSGFIPVSGGNSGGDIIIQGGSLGSDDDYGKAHDAYPGSILFKTSFISDGYATINHTFMDMFPIKDEKVSLSIFGTRPSASGTFNGTTENIIYLNSGTLHADDRPAVTSTSAIYYEQSTEDLRFSQNTAEESSLNTRTGTFSFSVGTAATLYTSVPVGISGLLPTDDIWIRLADPAGDGLLDTQYPILGWKCTTPGTLDVFVSGGGLPNANFIYEYRHR